MVAACHSIRQPPHVRERGPATLAFGANHKSPHRPSRDRAAPMSERIAILICHVRHQQRPPMIFHVLYLGQAWPSLYSLSVKVPFRLNPIPIINRHGDDTDQDQNKANQVEKDFARFGGRPRPRETPPCSFACARSWHGDPRHRSWRASKAKGRCRSASSHRASVSARLLPPKLRTA